MKILVLFIALSSLAQASYYAERCSNPFASVKWESGHNSNTVTIRTGEDEEKNIDIHKLNIKMKHTNVLKEESSCKRNFYQMKKVYTAEATLTPAPGHEDVLDFTGDERKISVDVICQYDMNSRSQCP